MRYLNSGVRCFTPGIRVANDEIRLASVGIRHAALGRALFTLFAAIIIFSSASPADAAIIRVPHDFQSIQAAIDSAQSGDEVWVNGGTYAESITLRSGVGVYGGFAGSETSHDDRDLPLNMSVLDGSNIGGRQAQHVVTMDKVTSVTLDGFVVKGGKSNRKISDDFWSPAGSGIFSTGTLKAAIRNCQLRENAGGSAYNALYGCALFVCNGSLDILGCEISSNLSLGSSGAISIWYTTATIANCSVNDNYGTGLDAYASHVLMQNSTVFRNWRGAVFSSDYRLPASINVDRCSFVDNYEGLSIGSVINNVSNSEFIGNGWYGLTGSNLNLEKCRFVSNNLALLTDGVATDSTFCGNNQIWYDYGYSKKMYVRNSLFVNNIGAPPSNIQNCISQDNGFRSGIADNTVFLGTYQFSGTANNCVFFEKDRTTLANSVGGYENIIADPGFLPPRKGHWTAAPVYDPVSTQTTLTDASTPFAPNEIVGKIIKVNSEITTSSCFVVSNTTHSITVYGNVANATPVGAEWHIMNYHVAYGSSPCVDRGKTIAALKYDLEGRPRPLIGAYDIGVYEYPGVEGPGGVVDLAPESIWLKDPASYWPNESVLLGCNIRNWGDRNSTSCLFTVSVDDKEAYQGKLAPIAAYGGPSINTNISLGPLSTGKHQVSIIADSGYQIADRNRDNNTLNQEIYINEPTDLQITAKVSPEHPGSKDHLGIIFTIRNASNVRVPSAGITLALTEFPFTQWIWPNVAIAANETKDFALPIGRMPPGNYAFIGTVIPAQPVQEKNNSDNIVRFKITVVNATKASDEWILY